MKLLLSAILATVLTSCTSIDGLDASLLNAGTEGHKLRILPIKNEPSESDLVGTYRFGDGFWNWEIHLEEDKTFGHVWISDDLVEAKDGSIGFESGVDTNGTWTLEGNTVILSYEESTAYRLVMTGKNLSLVEPIQRSDFHRVYVKTDAPLTIRNET